jgi:nicotinate-nucleotide adenylyltransferase
MDIAESAARLAMCRLAIEGVSGFAVDDLELSRAGPSFTLHTARALRARGWDEVHWLIGTDQLTTLPNWHGGVRLLDEVTFHIVARPGWALDWSRLPPRYQQLRDRILEAPLIDISATEIRQRVRADRPIDFLTPPQVVDYVREHRLYRD